MSRRLSSRCDPDIIGTGRNFKYAIYNPKAFGSSKNMGVCRDVYLLSHSAVAT